MPALLTSLRQSQLYRLEHLVEWLREGRCFTRRSAARAFQVSVRTVANDIERMKYLGVPVDYHAGRNTYVLTEPFDHLPFLSIRRTDWAAFLVACFALDALGDTPDAGPMRGPVERLSLQVPPEVQVHPDTLNCTIQIDQNTRPLHPVRYLESLRAAAETQQVVCLRYRGNNRNEETAREVEPYRLLHRDGYWYLIAYCRWREGLRSFRVDRIRGLSVTEEVFLHDPELDLDAYLDETFGMHWDAEKHLVCIRFSPYQARWIREEEWHPTQTLVERADGSVELRMEVTGLADVTRWVLSYGGEAEVLSLPVLRHRVGRDARRMAVMYPHEASGLHQQSSGL